MQAHIELNEIEIYLNAKILRNNDTINDLIAKGQLKKSKLRPSEYLDSIFDYWNGGKVNDPLRECLFVKLKHPLS